MSILWIVFHVCRVCLQATSVLKTLCFWEVSRTEFVKTIPVYKDPWKRPLYYVSICPSENKYNKMYLKYIYFMLSILQIH